MKNKNTYKILRLVEVKIIAFLMSAIGVIIVWFMKYGLSTEVPFIEKALISIQLFLVYFFFKDILMHFKKVHKREIK